MEIGIAFKDSEDWDKAVSLVRNKYQRSFSADVMPQPSCFVVCNTRPPQGDGGLHTVACAGITFSEQQALFSESYLDEPIEQLLARREGEAVRRETIAEIGSLASSAHEAGVELVKLLPILTWCLGKHYVLCTATRQLKRLFDRIGFDFRPLQLADPHRLNGDVGRWGTYYDNRPLTGYFRVIQALQKTCGSDVGRYNLSDVRIRLQERQREEICLEAC